MRFRTTEEDGETDSDVRWRLFRRRAAATENALSPTVDSRVRRTSRGVDQVERNSRRRKFRSTKRAAITRLGSAKHSSKIGSNTLAFFKCML